MSWFATDEAPPYLSWAKDSDDDEDQELKAFEEDYARSTQIIEDAVRRFSKEYLHEQGRLVHFVERSVLYDHSTKKEILDGVTLRNDSRGVYAKVNLGKGSFMVERQSIIRHEGESLKEVLEKHSRLLPCQISAYCKMVAMLQPDGATTPTSKIDVLEKMLELFAWNFDKKEIVFSNWRSGMLNFMHHSLENANMIREVFYTKSHGYLAVLFCTRDISVGEELTMNYLSPHDTFTTCKRHCARKYTTLPLSLRTTWTDMRNTCARLYFAIQKQADITTELKRLDVVFNTAPFLEDAIATLLLFYLMKHVLPSPGEISCETFMKTLKHFPGLMKSLGKFRDMVVRKVYKRWAFERIFNQKKKFIPFA